MSKIKVYTFSGKAMHGKDTLAMALKREFEGKGEKVLIIHLADYLKFLARTLYGWDGNKDKQGRTLLQKLGQDLRVYNPTILIERLSEIIDLVKEDYDYIFVPDVRFPNELDFFKEHFDTTSFHVYRKHFLGEEILTEEQKNNITETSMGGVIFDVNYVFEGTDLSEVSRAAKKFKIQKEI